MGGSGYGEIDEGLLASSSVSPLFHPDFSLFPVNPPFSPSLVPSCLDIKVSHVSLFALFNNLKALILD